MGPDAPPTRQINPNALHSELTQTDPDGRIDGVRAPAQQAKKARRGA
jgi:hypothetical protein